eukprot:TRINITY_DN57434_c0_g1_i1.p1 TRINITY_DN57434_c0_g1~~TRINITY_DN57434_c0_g1_i1.p1  ORF type:complete len:236 (+),score=65.74 TRINITY_DN57434_c0_g1_i1:96-803(+)
MAAANRTAARRSATPEPAAGIHERLYAEAKDVRRRKEDARNNFASSGEVISGYFTGLRGGAKENHPSGRCWRSWSTRPGHAYREGPVMAAGPERHEESPSNETIQDYFKGFRSHKRNEEEYARSKLAHARDRRGQTAWRPWVAGMGKAYQEAPVMMSPVRRRSRSLSGSPSPDGTSIWERLHRTPSQSSMQGNSREHPRPKPTGSSFSHPPPPPPQKAGGASAGPMRFARPTRQA